MFAKKNMAPPGDEVAKRLNGMVERGDGSSHAVGNRLKLIRLVIGNPPGLTQRQMADVLGIKEQNYAHIENGRTYPRPPYINRLRDAYGVDHNFVYSGDWSNLPANLVERLSELDAK